MDQYAEKRILLVEDNSDDLELTLDVFRLHKLDKQVVVAHDGQEALDCLFGEGKYTSVGPFRPSIILLDLNLPRLSGLQVLERLRSDEKTKQLPVVVLTSSSEDEDRLSSYNLGANGYVRKPVDFDRFIDLVSALNLYWLSLNEPP